MRLSGINAGLPFKAQVESTNPLISGNWAHLEDPQKPNPNATSTKPKKSHWLRNTIITLAAVAVLGYGLIKARGTEKISRIMTEGANTFGEKVLKYVGIAGDYAQKGVDAVKGLGSKIAGIFKGEAKAPDV